MRSPAAVTSTGEHTDRGEGVVNVAHRGASADLPENTLSAIRGAIDAGADMVEVDVQRSKDGALVLAHDTTLARTTDVRRAYPGRAPWSVADFTYDELMRLDAGSWKSSRFTGERIPTLAEAIETVRGSSVGLLLELKYPGLHPGLVTDVVGTLHETPGYVDSAVAAGRLVVQSFSFAAMKDHKTQAPHVPVGLLGTPSRANLPVLGSWADQVNPSHFSVDWSYVDQVHDLGMTCFVWTVDRRPATRHALRLGVDGVITNRPAALARLLAGRGVSGHHTNLPA